MYRTIKGTEVTIKTVSIDENGELKSESMRKIFDAIQPEIIEREVRKFEKAHNAKCFILWGTAERIENRYELDDEIFLKYATLISESREFINRDTVDNSCVTLDEKGHIKK